MGRAAGRAAGAASESPALRPGSFYGRVARQLKSELVTLSVLSHAQARRVPEHSHQHAFLTLLLRGGYREEVAGRRLVYAPLTLVFHPEGLLHQDEIAEGGADFFAVEVAPGLARERDERLRGLGSLRELSGGEAVWKMLRLYRDFVAGEATALVLEEPVAEILDALGESGGAGPRRDPAWLDGVQRTLDTRFREPLSLAGLADEAGVHPVHLSRVYRQRRGRSLRAALHRLRVREACRLFQEGLPLAEVAVETGFVDQSHLTHVFRRVTGFTPGALRGLLGAAPEGGASLRAELPEPGRTQAR